MAFVGWDGGVQSCLGSLKMFSCFRVELTWFSEAAIDLCLVPFQVWEGKARRQCTVRSGKLTPVSVGP